MVNVVTNALRFSSGLFHSVFLPPANEVCEGMFLQVSTGGSLHGTWWRGGMHGKGGHV